MTLELYEQKLRTRDLVFSFEGSTWDGEEVGYDLDETWDVGDRLDIGGVEYEIYNLHRSEGLIYAQLMQVDDEDEDLDDEI